MNRTKNGEFRVDNSDECQWLGRSKTSMERYCPQRQKMFVSHHIQRHPPHRHQTIYNLDREHVIFVRKDCRWWWWWHWYVSNRFIQLRDRRRIGYYCRSPILCHTNDVCLGRELRRMQRMVLPVAHNVIHFNVLCTMHAQTDLIRAMSMLSMRILILLCLM